MWVILGQEVLVRNTELTCHHQPEEFRKGQKETPHVLPPPRVLLSGIHFGWAMPSPPGSSLSQDDWPTTTWKLTQLPSTQVCEAQGRAFLLASLILLLSAQAPLPNNVSYCVSTCVSSDNSCLSTRQEPLFKDLEEVSSSCNNIILW